MGLGDVKMFKLETLVSVIIGFCVLCFTITIVLLTLDKMGDANIPMMYCEDTGGKFMFYECCNTLGSCSKVNKTGYWCDYPDGRSLSKDEIWGIFNTTV